MDSRICQTSTASPAEPGGLSFWTSAGCTDLPQCRNSENRFPSALKGATNILLEASRLH